MNDGYITTYYIYIIYKKKESAKDKLYIKRESQWMKNEDEKRKKKNWENKQIYVITITIMSTTYYHSKK